MGRQYYFLGSILLIILFAGSAYSEISQYFDQEGNLALSSKKKATELIPKIRRYSIPEGIELHKDITYEYYPVFGKTFSEIVNSSEENGPFNKKENRRLPSKSEWTLGWSYQFGYSYEIDEESKTVHLAIEIYDIDIEYDITLTLPTLLDDTALNSIEKNLWKNYLLRLLEHEHDHVKIIQDLNSKNAVLNNFKDINYLILDYRSDIDIDIDIEKIAALFIKDETSRIGREWVKQIKSRNDEYDRITDHGKRHEMRESFFKQ